MDIFLQGLLLGFSIAAPVGPIGILCIRRTLVQGRLSGFVSGLGAASADALYGVVAAFGLGAVTSLFTGLQLPLRLLGGIFLLYLGIQTLRALPAQEAAAVKTNGKGLATDYLSTVFLTLSNPMTILSFAGAFSALDFSGAQASAGWLVLGVLLGSAAWWLGLSLLVGSLRERFTPGMKAWVNRASGVIILAFALWLLAGLAAEVTSLS